MQAKITKRTVDTATADGADLWVWDSQLKGFGLRVRPNGHKTYVVEYRPGAGGRGAVKRRYTIGRHGSPWTADTARTEAERILGLVRNGADPVADKTAHKVAPTVKELGSRFLKEHADTKRKPATAAQYRRLLDQFIFPTIGRKKVADVTRQDVMKLHTGLHETPYQANRILALISTLFTFAERVGERPDGSNPARHVERYKEEVRERMLSADELAWIGEALTMIGTAADKVTDIRARLNEAHQHYEAARAINDRRAGGAARRELEALRAELRAVGANVAPTQAIACIRLLIFTGARLSEILKMKWEWINFERAELRLPDSKTGRKTIHLPAPALEVLAGLDRIDGNPYVIVGEKKGRHFVGIQRPWQRVRNAATVKGWARGDHAGAAALVARLAHELGREPSFEECREAATKANLELPTVLSDLRIHDLRHAYASVAACSGMALPIIGKLLGHTQAATTQRYAHLAADPVKAAAASVAGRIAEAMKAGSNGDQVSQNIVPFPHGAA